MSAIPHVGDVGIVLQFQVFDETGTAIDLSSETTLEIIFDRPGDTTLTVSPTFVNTGTDGLIQYATISGDLSVDGTWQAQVHYVLANGEAKRSDIPAFQVYPNLT